MVSLRLLDLLFRLLPPGTLIALRRRIVGVRVGNRIGIGLAGLELLQVHVEFMEVPLRYLVVLVEPSVHFRRLLGQHLTIVITVHYLLINLL